MKSIASFYQKQFHIDNRLPCQTSGTQQNEVKQSKSSTRYLIIIRQFRTSGLSNFRVVELPTKYPKASQLHINNKYVYENF